MNETPKTSALSQFLDRRGFLRTSVAAGTAVHLATSKSAIAQATSSDRVLKVAIAGTGSQGQRLLECSKEIPGIQFVAACDPFEFNLRRGLGIIKYKWGEPRTYTDYEEMLAKEKEVDAVLVATPDFLHHTFTRLGLQAGKAVYCEKMMSHSIEAAADMVKAQRETGGILQIGHQRHSNPRYQHVRDRLLAAGVLGRITHCYAQWNRGVSQSKKLEVPKGTTLDPAMLAKWGFNSPEEFMNWRWFSKYSAGPISDLGAHQIGMFNWFFSTKDKPVTPVSVFAQGGVDYYDGSEGRMKAENPDNVMAMYEYDSPQGKRRCYYQVLTTTGSQQYFEKLMGVDGTVVISELDTNGNQVYRETSAPEWAKFGEGDNPILRESAGTLKNKFWEHRRTWEKPKVRTMGGPYVTGDTRVSKAAENWEIPVVLTSPPHAPHLANFFECVRKKDASGLTCTVEEAYRICVTVLKCYDSIKSGQRYVFKPEDFTV